jgi:DNA mismatch endonuclease (patch repair protein)
MKSIRARAPRASSPAVRRVMQANRSFDTALEALLRSELHRSGLRFRKHRTVDARVKCKADIIFPRAQVCVFVDGCYWHGCPKHFRTPSVHSAWWNEKIADNRQRDRRKTAALRRQGWTVIRVWEHQISDKGVPSIARAISTVVRAGKRLAHRKCPLTHAFSTWPGPGRMRPAKRPGARGVE